MKSTADNKQTYSPIPNSIKHLRWVMYCFQVEGFIVNTFKQHIITSLYKKLCQTNKIIDYENSSNYKEKRSLKVSKSVTFATTVVLVWSVFFTTPSFAQQTQKKPTAQKPTTSKQVSTRKNTAKTYAKAKDTTNYEAVKKIKIWKVEEIYGKEKTILIVQKCLLEEINKLRAEKKLQPLVMDTSLNKAAQLYADEIVVNKRFCHTWKGWTTPGSRGMAQWYPNDKIWENILYDWWSIENAIKDRIESSEHFENIMDSRFSRFWAGYCNFNWVTMFGIQ